jgi:protoporphyrinogen oxidase
MQRDVVVIGAGLSGLAAALELERAAVSYTLIEVKRRLGGSLASDPHPPVDPDLRGQFVIDTGPMAQRVGNVSALEAYLNALGLEDALIRVPDDDWGARVMFRAGAGMLIDALAGRITAPVMRRMAVSTLGYIDDRRSRCAICLENGMLLDAKALIVAAPARHAERMFHTLVPEISFKLVDYRYDSIARVSLGYSASDVSMIPAEPPDDYPVNSVDHTAAAGRAPENCALIQVGVRFDPDKGVPADVVGQVAALFGWPLNPLAEVVTVWPEADPLMWLDEAHPANLRHIGSLLPDNVAIAGSDYLPVNEPPRLDARIASGQAAARRVLDYLRR